MEYSNKTILCKYYLENKCKFINTPTLCKFAHGKKDIKIIKCKYGNYCYTRNCSFYHESINIPNINFNLLDFVKNKKSIKRKNNIYILNDIKDNENIDKCINSGNEDYKILPNENEAIQTTTITNYYDIYKELDLFKNINICCVSDKIIDNRFNNIIHKISCSIKNKYINIIKEKNKIITQLKKYQKKEKPNLKLFNKYSKIYTLFNEKKYEEIKNISKDKNLYKLKLRSKRVKEYLDIIKKNNINILLPISKIINSTKLSFQNIIQNTINTI